LVPNSEYELYDHLSKPDQATSSAAPRAAKAAAVTIGAIMVALFSKKKVLRKRRKMYCSRRSEAREASNGFMKVVKRQTSLRVLDKARSVNDSTPCQTPGDPFELSAI
jgi:hypothetical protein